MRWASFLTCFLPGVWDINLSAGLKQGRKRNWVIGVMMIRRGSFWLSESLFHMKIATKKVVGKV